MKNNKLVKSTLNNHTPHDIQSGWHPKSNEVLLKFHKKIKNSQRTEYSPAIKKLEKFINENSVIKYLFTDACKKNINLIEGDNNIDNPDKIVIPRITSIDEFLHGMNVILKQPPSFVDDELVGLPFSAWVVGLDPTLSGQALFSLPMLNEIMSEILHEWFVSLGSHKTGEFLFGSEGEQWLSEKAKLHYRFDDWKKDSEHLPYWNSWNSFFTRDFKNKNTQRPVSDPDSNKVISSPNDGSLFCWESNVKSKDVFWFKDMRYSISDILSSSIKEQQDLIDEHDLVNIFSDGYVFQTYLNPYNFHRWWSPVNGEVLFDPILIPGCYFNKIVIPDYEGAATASLPYSTQVNARGLIVFKTDGYGLVCCIPLGMGEVSTISFNEKMVKGESVKKGQEIGMFNYGGSSFVLIFQNLPNKKLIFIDDNGSLIPNQPTLPSGSASTGGVITNIGAKIAQWVDL